MVVIRSLLPIVAQQLLRSRDYIALLPLIQLMLLHVISFSRFSALHFT